MGLGADLVVDTDGEVDCNAIAIMRAHDAAH